MGAIMTVGISVSNSILVVSFANDIRARQGLRRWRRSIEAGQTRLRPDPDDRDGDDPGHDPHGAGPGRSGRAECAAGPRRDRRAAAATVATLFIVPISYTLLRRKPPSAL